VKEEAVANPIYDISPFTMLDYPDKTACILWFAGCNMRCLYCYNPDIVLGKGKISYDAALQFIASRKGLLDGVVLSGGECSLHSGLHAFIKEIKSMGMSVKMDTNGSNPERIKSLLNLQLIDYIALDFKAPKIKFEKITQSNLFANFEKTLSLLISAALPFEVRTTVHSDLLNAENIEEMTHYLDSKNYSGNYYLQYFKEDVPTMVQLGSSQKLKITDKISTKNITLVERE